jgi:uncharacterized protein (DUF58 family)
VRGPLRTALSALTLRGRCLVAAGATMVVLGALLGERGLLQAGVFVLALPLLAAALVARERFRLSSRRTVTPSRVPRGADADVQLEITNADRRTGGSWLLSEQLPPELGPAPQFLVERLAGRATAALHYRVRGARRGRHLLGPLRLRLVDPFGLVERTVAGVDTAPLLVVPRVRPLGRGGPSGGHGSGGEGARRSLAVHGEDDVSARPYRHGDDLRKVHWRATARTGDLMVRLEERPWRSQATLFLDTRARGHLVVRREAGSRWPGPPGDPCPPTDSLEWLVEAAASIGTALAGRGSVLRTVTDSGELRPSGGRGGLTPEELLERLAVVRPSRVTGLGPAVQQLARAAGEGPVICLLGAVGADDVVDLVRARAGPVTDAAVLTDVGAWADAGLGRGRRSLPGSARSELAAQREEVETLLRAAGWQVAVARPDSTVEQVWSELGGSGRPAPAGASPAPAAGIPAVPA